MRKFIEVSTEDRQQLVNVDQIYRVEDWETTGTTLVFKDYITLRVAESYEQIKELLK